MIISKQSKKIDLYKRAWFDYPRARDAFEAYLLSLKLKADESILLPNFIGYSENEGSGVFDPVIRSAVNYKFYKLDKNLEIDISSVRQLIEKDGVRLIVLIHYFGYIDKNYIELINLARKNNVLILEDQAHSLFTDIYGGISGRFCDASIYSLHKMFPVDFGGGLSITGTDKLSESKYMARLCLDYDINKISKNRIENAFFVNEFLKGNEDILDIMRTSFPDGCVPQTFPILIKNSNRDVVYFKMNDLGFGVVSLYHTMISEISTQDNFETNETSRKILNLPIHQEANQTSLKLMCNALMNILRNR